MEMIEEVKEIMDAIEQTAAQGQEMPNLSVKSVMDSMEEEDWGTDPRGIICDGDGCVIVPVNIPPEGEDWDLWEPALPNAIMMRLVRHDTPTTACCV
jgi:hypothetical protein